MPALADQPLGEEPGMPAAPIIAVFGSGKGLGLAKAIGNEVGKHDCVLLTGGAGPAGEMVKNKALAGADEAARGGALAPWIGVPKAGDLRTKPKPDESRSYLLETGLGDERNYLEAVLCNVAIAIEGGDGTKSEVGFCLALQRPVVLVGDWSEVRIAGLAEAIDHRILKKEIDPNLRLLIQAAKSNMAHNVLPGALSLEVDATLVVDQAKAAAGSAIEYAYPDLRILESCRAPYLNWVHAIVSRLKGK